MYYLFECSQQQTSLAQRVLTSYSIKNSMFQFFLFSLILCVELNKKKVIICYCNQHCMINSVYISFVLFRIRFKCRVNN